MLVSTFYVIVYLVYTEKSSQEQRKYKLSIQGASDPIFQASIDLVEVI